MCFFYRSFKSSTRCLTPMCLSLVIPCSYWASACYAVLPSRKTLYMISFRQTRDLPVVSLFPHPASFRFPSRGHPCLRLYPSHCRADSGLAPIRNVRRQAHINKKTTILSCIMVSLAIINYILGARLRTCLKKAFCKIFCKLWKCNVL